MFSLREHDHCDVLGGLPPAVVNTITSARAPSTRHAYRLKWNLFVNWCSSRQEDPCRYPIRVVLSFLQDGLERRLSPSTLKVYVAAITAQHDAVYGKSVGKHDLVIRYLREVQNQLFDCFGREQKGKGCLQRETCPLYSRGYSLGL